MILRLLSLTGNSFQSLHTPQPKGSMPLFFSARKLLLHLEQNSNKNESPEHHKIYFLNSKSCWSKKALLNMNCNSLKSQPRALVKRFYQVHFWCLEELSTVLLNTQTHWVKPYAFFVILRAFGDLQLLLTKNKLLSKEQGKQKTSVRQECSQ